MLLQPVITVDIYYIGTAEEGEPWAKPFWDLGQVSIKNYTTTYSGSFVAAGTGVNDFVCKEPFGPSYLFSIGLQTYNVPVIGQRFKLFSNKVKQNPTFSQSSVMLEGYSLEAVKAVDPASTAFAHRDDTILIGFLPSWPLNSGLDKEAEDWGKQAHARVQSGVQPPRPQSAYVNYAYGDEPLEAIYGHEPWRLAELRNLKKQYDPDIKFIFLTLFINPGIPEVEGELWS
ncbi:MAG: hypothetical protein Q9218_003412 [Villophora microphyllina]